MLSFTLLAGALLATPVDAAIVDWQNVVLASPTAASATYFDTASGFAPVTADVGPLSGDRSFEFIVNAGLGGASSAFMGARGVNGNQGLKFEQWPDTLVMGMTAFGSVDYSSSVFLPTNVQTHVAFVSDGFSGTQIYVNGAFAYTFVGVPLAASGPQGLGGILDTTGLYFDTLDGQILGFASYDYALTPEQVAERSNAVTVPEPSSLGMLGAAAVCWARRRRNR